MNLCVLCRHACTHHPDEDELRVTWAQLRPSSSRAGTATPTSHDLQHHTHSHTNANSPTQPQSPSGTQPARPKSAGLVRTFRPALCGHARTGSSRAGSCSGVCAKSQACSRAATCSGRLCSSGGFLTRDRACSSGGGLCKSRTGSVSGGLGDTAAAGGASVAWQRSRSQSGTGRVQVPALVSNLNVYKVSVMHLCVLRAQQQT